MNKSIMMALVCGASVPAVAQQVAPAQPAPAIMAQPLGSPGPGRTVLPANTEVVVTLNQEVSSKKFREGQPFDVSVAREVTMGDYVVIPRGTRGRGQVTWRTGKGAFGKSAKMEIEVRSLELNGRTIPVSGKFRQEGGGNTGATVGAVVGFWPAAPFITGKSAIFEQGRELKTFTVEAMPVEIAPVVQPVPIAAPVASTSSAGG